MGVEVKDIVVLQMNLPFFRGFVSGIVRRQRGYDIYNSDYRSL